MSNAISPAEAQSFSDSDVPPVVENREVVSGRHLLIDAALVMGWVLMVDWLVYQVGSFFSWGVLLVLAVSLLAAFRLRVGNSRRSSWLALALLLLGLKLIWGGSLLQIACGLGLLVCYGMALAGYTPFMPEAIGFLGLMCVGATRRLRAYRIVKPDGSLASQKPGLSVVLPVGMVVCFATLFVLANPDLATGVSRQFRIAFDSLGRMLTGFNIGEAVLWFGSGFLMLGLLYPARVMLLAEKKPAELDQTPALSGVYLAYRNTLLSVILLFAVYLVFEFSTLWFRNFPKNFYYAGYAHQGAFWLTVALALATVVLSAIFRGSVLADGRLKSLKRLALIWSVENLLLSAAVYNRMLIYIDFNGMTQMRVIGIFGITSVVVGFMLVVVKLYRDYGFTWLLHRQLWVPLLAVVLYAILPIDWIVNRYNAAQVQRGNLAPSVQIAAHVVSAEGILPLVALVDCEDQKIRDGVRALLAMWSEDLKNNVSSPYMRTYSGVYRGNWHSEYDHHTPWLQLNAGFSHPGRATEKPWQSFQLSNYILQSKLNSVQSEIEPFIEDARSRDLAIDVFFEYAYQWY
jgi:Domain of unknown function (DUF4173)